MIRIEEFKEKLIDRLEEKGGIYAPKLMQNIGENGCRYKKIFAFKKAREEDIMEYLDFVALAIIKEINCNYFMFNPRVENFKDTTDSHEYIRGMVYYERVKRTDG